MRVLSLLSWCVVMRQEVGVKRFVRYYHNGFFCFPQHTNGFSVLRFFHVRMDTYAPVFEFLVVSNYGNLK